MKIAFFDAKEYEIPYFEQYGREGQVGFHFFETPLDRLTARLCEGFDGVCVFVNDCLDGEVLKILAECGVTTVALRCAGYNNVDLAAKGALRVVHVPGYSPHAVAEHAMGMLLSFDRGIHKAYNRTRDFNFSLEGLVGFDLHGKTAGVIGTGRIGMEFVKICRGFGMRVVAYDRVQGALPDAPEYRSFSEVLAESDVLSFHCPLTDESYHMLGKEEIELMKKGAVVINTSRGALIDTEALLEGIKKGRIGGACLDVYEEEAGVFFEDNSNKILEDDLLARLITMPNVLVTSHQAFLTHEALDAIAKTTVSNILDLAEKGSCENELVPGDNS
jgi:D-lactate dehydrogenase